MASAMKQRHREKAAVEHVHPLPLGAHPPLSPLAEAGQDVERESVDRRRNGRDQNSRTQHDTVQKVQGTSAEFT